MTSLKSLLDNELPTLKLLEYLNDLDMTRIKQCSHHSNALINRFLANYICHTLTPITKPAKPLVQVISSHDNQPALSITSCKAHHTAFLAH